MALQVLDHPFAGHLLGRLRDKSTKPDAFRAHCRSLTSLLAIAATACLKTRAEVVETPVAFTSCLILDQSVVAVPILRAGLGMLEPVTQLFPDVSVGYIGLERNEDTAEAHSYYCKLPELKGQLVLLLDPMLATGGSACQAVELIKQHGGEEIKMVAIVAAPEGVELMTKSHPDVDIFTASVDEGLNGKKYIVPGLGDFGDRLYGTL